MADQARVLVVQHEAEAPPGWLGDWLTTAGLTLDVRHAYAGQPLPSSPAGYAGLLVLGGAMGAYDDEEHPWLSTTKELLRSAVESELPTLGVCLGHQLASVALGGSVAKHRGGRQVGVRPIRWTRAVDDDAVFAPAQPTARGLQWNEDVVVDVPPGAVVLAGSDDDGPQVLRFGPRAWGVQFHPEVGFGLVDTWASSQKREGDDHDPDVAAALLALEAAEPELRRTWQPAAQRFARLVRSG